MFCLNYYPNHSYLKDVEELKISYRATDRTLEDFLRLYQDKKTIVIDVTNSFEEIDAQLLQGLSAKYQNIKLIIDINDSTSIGLVRMYKLPFFFANFASTIDDVYRLMSFHPTDIYICAGLGFQLNKISKLLHNNHIKVRVFPNICQSSFSEIPSLKTFFIRPEDIPIYAKYVDVFELISDADRQGIIYKIYKQQKWFGDISEIIPSFKGKLDSRFLLSTFGESRVKCGRRCLIDPNSCSICDTLAGLAEALEKEGIVVKATPLNSV